MSDSGSEHSQPAKMKPHKLFITGMNGSSDLKQLQQDLRAIFQKYGDLEAVVPKRSYNGAYCFAFIDFKEGEDATVAVQKQSNDCYIGGKKITQEEGRERKIKYIHREGCFECGKPGHFARECRNKSSKGRRDRSRSDSHRHHKKKKRRHSYSSYSSSRSRSRSFRKEKKKKHSKSHKHKKSKSKSKKHKKQRRRSYSSD